MARFADVVDMAQAHIELETEMQIARILRGNRTCTGSPHCIDCGAPIPAERRRHVPNAVRCVHCQDLDERGR